MATTTAFKNLLLNASDINTLSLHSDDPGAAGTANEVTGNGYARQSIAFDAAADGERAMSADVDFSTPANQPITYLGFWTGSVFRSAKPVIGDMSANASGQYRVTTDTVLALSDLA